MRALSLVLVAVLPVAVGADPDRAEPSRALELSIAALHVERCALDRAETAYERRLVRDPLDPDALAGRGEIRRRQGRVAEALGRAEQALLTSGGRRTPAVWRLKAHALVELGDADLALAPALLAVGLEPVDARNHEVLARALYRTGDMAAAGRALRRAAALDPRTEEANLRLGSGFGPEVEDASWREGPLAEDFRRALRAWRAGDPSRALRLFTGLCRRRGDVYKFRLGLGLLRREMRRREEVAFGGRSEAAYALAPAPEVEGLDLFVPDYADLDEVAAHALRVAVAPARRWVPGLLDAGATHAIMSLETSLAEVEGVEGIRGGARTFDGRLYEHLRGVGGLHAASGVERLHAAARFAYHLFAHEFAHQVLRYAFPEDLQAEVGRLYRAARAADRCLDWYGAANPDEYFAQGYEAFVSHAKRGCLKETQRHTRDELRGRDPDLYAFLEAHLDLSYETATRMAAFRRAIEAARGGR